MAIASMVALAFLIPLALLVQQLAQERALAQAERQTAIVVSVLAVTSDPSAVEQVIATAQDDQTERIAVHGLAEEPVGTSHADADDIALAARERETVTASVPGGVAYLEAVEVGEDEVAVVEVHVPSSELREGVRQAWWALAAVAVGLVAGSALLGDRLAARMVRPARSLADAANALGDGHLDVRVHPTGPQELAEAGLAFNHMANRVAALRAAEREMVADLSHRLRTPLTGLRLDVEAMEAAADPIAGDDAERYRTVGRVRQALAALEHEIDVLIRTTREATAAHHHQPSTAPGRCDASEVVAERLVFWSAVAGDQDRPCEVVGTHVPAPVSVPASELGAALDAVLGNVFRYTAQGTAMEVAVSRHDGWVAVRVDDAGDGIADPDRALTRGASDRGSTGLGLDIARRVARAGGGSVSIDQGRLGGASVVMLFADVEAPPPPQPSRLGLIGRLTREPRESLDRARAHERARDRPGNPLGSPEPPEPPGQPESWARERLRARGWPRQRRPPD